jgi:predicted nuclease of predicted toxin-antitoxin system
MKPLLDACVWGGVVKQLESAGHDVVWAGDWPENPSDEEILKRAHRENRILVTLGKDFGELAIVHGMSHSGIVRLVSLSSRQQGSVCQGVVDRHGEELLSGAIVTAEPHRLRIRPPESGEK